MIDGAGLLSCLSQDEDDEDTSSAKAPNDRRGGQADGSNSVYKSENTRGSRRSARGTMAASGAWSWCARLQRSRLLVVVPRNDLQCRGLASLSRQSVSRFRLAIKTLMKDGANRRDYGPPVVLGVVSGIAGATLLYQFMPSPQPDLTDNEKKLLLTNGKLDAGKRKLTSREKRFLKFASVEFDGQIYMTPLDFLESVIEGEPRPRFKRKRLALKDVEELHSNLPVVHRNNEHLFRNIGNKGIISFSEYLFLLTILTKPKSGFKIAFSMLDRDGNERIDKAEFRVLESVFSSATKDRKQKPVDKIDAPAADKVAGQPLHGDEAGGKGLAIDTTLVVYFFGKSGDETLKFEDFRRFTDNLQTEVLQMEFQEFSKGAKAITELDFARILLRYTFLNVEEYESILNRLVGRLQDADTGITFEEFRDFCLFLNNLDDFQIAMKMYTLADKAISEEEFSRAVAICIGRQLSNHVVHTVFQIFDNDEDGLLSYQEFVAIMKDRLNRGFKSFSRHEGWTGFKRCVKQEVRAK